jgi:hypothetical protein
VAQGLPTRKQLATGVRKWITRERPKIDRIACPWLIRRFIDPEAEFIYVPAEQVLAEAKAMGAIPYDIPDVEFTHEGERCSFDTFLRIYDIADPPLQRLALIVRGADTSRHDLAPQCSGLFAISLGLSANFPEDHAMLEHGMAIYDASIRGAAAFRRKATAGPPRVKSRSRDKPIEESATMRTRISVLAFILALAFIGKSHAGEIDWAKVDAALGKTASVHGEVHRYGLPRTDLQVTLDGVTIKPALALGGWLGFEPMQDGAVVMGDLVLTETEVNPVMSKLLESGIEITAVHNHLMRASPTTFYMHIHGHGDPVAMATALRAALAESKTPFAAPSTSAAQAAQIELDTDKLDAAIGPKGKVNGGVYQFVNIPDN